MNVLTIRWVDISSIYIYFLRIGPCCEKINILDSRSKVIKVRGQKARKCAFPVRIFIAVKHGVSWDQGK